MRRSICLAVVVIGACWLHTQAAVAAPDGNRLVTAKLLANVEAVRPGSEFDLGVLFQIEPGYHIYWINPGDSGLATKVKLTVSDQIELGPLQFPTPSRLAHTGDVANFGYERQVLLVIHAKASAQLKIGEPLALRGRASWLVCKDVCVPGKADLSLDLPVAAAETPANKPLFEQYQKSIPTADCSEAQHVSMTTLPDGRRQIGIVWKHAGDAATDLFPFPSDSVAVDNVVVNSSQAESTITFSARLLAGQTAPAEPLQVLVAWHGADQAGPKGWLLQVPLNDLKSGPTKGESP